MTSSDPIHFCARVSRRRRALTVLLTSVSILSAGAGASLAGEYAALTPPTSGEPSSNDALLKKLEVMEQRIKTLETRLKQKGATAQAQPVTASDGASKSASADAHAAAVDGAKHNAQPKSAAAAPAEIKPIERKPILGLADSPVAGLSIGAYGEVKYGMMQNPNAGGQWQNGFDAHRLVLLPTYEITNNIIFNAEIEFEHAGSGFDADDKLHGTAEIEQLWVDFKITDPFNWRAPGIDLIPIGYINQHHEPTQFYSVNRPELYNGLIPSTWKAGATSVYGTIADGLTYQIQASSSLEDFGNDFGTRTAANTVPAFPGVGNCTPCYAPGIDGANGLGFSLPVRGGFAQLSNDIAVAAKLDYAPPAVPGLAGSVSGYYTDNTTPRGAYADDGSLLGRSSLAMFDTEFRYRVPTTGFEMRGEFVHVTFGDPANLRANNDSDPTNNVGKTMFGASGEVAYHVPMGTILNSDWEAVPFYRYTYQNLQMGGFAGTDVNTPTGAGQTQFHTAGVAIFPSPKLVLKATYQKVINNDPAGAQSDSFLGAIGFFF
jgi:hypothetical protein